MNKLVKVFLATFALVLSAPAFAQQLAAKVQTLRGSDAATTVQAPPERSYKGKSPGSQKLVARTFSTQPPVIPHATEGVDTVTLQENQCLSCHGPENYKSTKAPKISASHFTDRDGKILPTVSAARYECTSCHVPQTDAKPLVESTFRGDTAKTKK